MPEDTRLAIQDVVGKYPGVTEGGFRTMLEKESGINPRARNPKSGAAGVFQLMPDQQKGIFRRVSLFTPSIDMLGQLNLVVLLAYGGHLAALGRLTLGDLVVFAGDAFIQCPLTTDYSAARLFLRAVAPVSMATQGTAIADALYEAREVLEGGGRGEAGKAVLLITDGEDHRGDAIAAASALADAGIRIFAVAVGGAEGEPIPVLDREGNLTGYKKDKEGRTVLTRTDAAGLRDLTARGNGLLLTASGADLGVLKFLPELEKIQKGEIESRLSVQYDDKYAWFAWPAFALLCAAAALGEGPLRRRPA